jgi:hypothetical protein
MNVLLAVLIVVAVSAVAIAAMLVVRRNAPDGSYFHDGDRAAGVFGVLATGFAVLLGFVSPSPSPATTPQGRMRKRKR